MWTLKWPRRFSAYNPTDSRLGPTKPPGLDKSLQALSNEPLKISMMPGGLIAVKDIGLPSMATRWRNDSPLEKQHAEAKAALSRKEKELEKALRQAVEQAAISAFWKVGTF